MARRLAPGWADLVAGGLAAASDRTFTYANLAIRGKLLAPILDDQLPAALRLGPDLLSISGGNNDILRPRVSIAANARRITAGLDAAVRTGTDVLFVTVADMTRHLPLAGSSADAGTSTRTTSGHGRTGRTSPWSTTGRTRGSRTSHSGAGPAPPQHPRPPAGRGERPDRPGRPPADLGRGRPARGARVHDRAPPRPRPAVGRQTPHRTVVRDGRTPKSATLGPVRE